MDTETVVWIVVAVIALLALIGLALIVARKNKAKRDEQHRREAMELRAEAREHVGNVSYAKVAAAEAEVRAERARLEAAEALSEREAAQQALEAEQEEYEQRLREADRLDPGVDHKAKDYRPTDATTTTTQPSSGDGTATRGSTAATGDTDGDTEGRHAR